MSDAGWARTVLVVDDDEAIRELVKVVLEDAGYGVRLAADVAAGRGILARERVAVVLLDTMGTNATVSFPEPHPPIVIFSARQPLDHFARSVGAAATLAKPFMIDDLVAVVRGFIPDSADMTLPHQ